ncbi:MAG TPA: hypothetical protein VFF51_07230, partial [Candidatus Methylomirabilis sp.]|nr:hypothetical protein [Candidatus Methylomirabilis sp.]
MGLFHGRQEKPTGPARLVDPAERQGLGDGSYYDLKTRIHSQLIERIDLSKLDILPPEQVRQQITRIIEDMLVEEETPLTRADRDQLV